MRNINDNESEQKNGKMKKVLKKVWESAFVQYWQAVLQPELLKV